MGWRSTRFSAELQSHVPLDEILEYGVPVPGSWRHLDGAFLAALTERGYERCIHVPPVTHWNKHLR